MKKLGYLLIVSLFIFSMNSAASAARYGFHDIIGEWGGDGFFGRVAIPNYPGTNSYQHDIRDEVDFAAGERVTKANLALDFDLDITDSYGTRTTRGGHIIARDNRAWPDRSTLFGLAETGSRRPRRPFTVPESGTMILLGMGVMGIAIPGRKKVFKKK